MHAHRRNPAFATKQDEKEKVYFEVKNKVGFVSFIIREKKELTTHFLICENIHWHCAGSKENQKDRRHRHHRITMRQFVNDAIV